MFAINVLSGTAMTDGLGPLWDVSDALPADGEEQVVMYGFALRSGSEVAAVAHGWRRRPASPLTLRTALLGFTLLVATDTVLAQFRQLRYEDDFSSQRAACGGDKPGGCWKDQPIGDHIRLTFGGDMRWRYEHTGNPRYGLDPQDPWGVWMQRHSAFVNFQVGRHWRAFAQLSTSLVNGRAADPSPVDQNRLDPTNLFVEWQTVTGGEASLGVRAGVQELQFGSGRGIDAREGPNVRRSFEAVRAYAAIGKWRIDSFAAAPRKNRQGSFDDSRSRSQVLHGIYATWTGGRTSWDGYALYFEDTLARYYQGLAHERRWSLGTRMFGHHNSWDWNWEALVQGGRFGTSDIQAWSFATDTGYTFANVTGKPRIALLVAIASGDQDPDDDRLGTFNPLYPRGNYFGSEASLGPRNFFNIHPAATFQLSPRLQLNASLDFFWRYSTRDGVYAPNGMLVTSLGESRARYVATIASLGANWTLAPGWSSSLVVAHSEPGAFLRDAGASDTLSHISLTLQYRY